jgi:hypothetical protein
MTPEALIAMALSHAVQLRIEKRIDYVRSAAISHHVHEFDQYMFNVEVTDNSVTFGLETMISRKSKSEIQRQKLSLKETISALLADVPDEEWAKMPEDFASTVEKQLYG